MHFETRPPVKAANTATQHQPHKKQGLWAKTNHVISIVSTKIYRGIKWLSSLPQKFYHALLPTKELSERSIKKLSTKPPINKKIKKSDNDIFRKKNNKPSIDLLINHTVSTAISPIIAESLKPYSSSSENTEQQRLIESSDSDFENDDNDNSQPPYFTNRKKRYRKKQSGERKTTQNPATEIKTNKIKSKPVCDKQLDNLAIDLTNRRKLIQKLITNTQLAFLRYGPSPTPTLSELQRIEEDSLNFTRDLLKHNVKAKMHPEISDIANSMEQDISGLKRFIQDAREYDFRSGHQYLKQIDIYEQLVQKLAEKENDIFKRKMLLDQAMCIINDKKDIGQFDGASVECISDNIDVFLKLDKSLRKIFPDSQLFDREMIKILSGNSSSFQTQLQVYLDGKWQEIRTTYTPAAAMRIYDPESSGTGKTSTRDPFANSYEGKFAPSMQRDASHAVNMMGYSMTIDGQQVTSQVRVGCPYAYAQKNSKDRKKVSLDRVKEIFTALLVQNHSEKLQNAIGDPEHRPIQLDAVYLSLLSPDNIRNNRLMATIGQDDEKKWVKKINNLLKDLSGKEMVLKVYLDSGKSANIKIVPNVAMFVIPCNQLALQLPPQSSPSKKTANYLLRSLADTWKSVNKINNEGLNWLMGPTLMRPTGMRPTGMRPTGLLNKKISLLPESKQKRAKELINDLQALLDSTTNDFEKIAKRINPFIFAEILSQLLEVLNIDIFSGCKSNKDRTSIFQTVLQALLATDMRLDERQANKTDRKIQPYALVAELLMVYGGHIEIQKRNTGLAGFCLDETPGKVLDKISYSLMRRKPMKGDRQQHFMFNNPDAFTPIKLTKT